jgi:hypothetical protein
MKITEIGDRQAYIEFSDQEVIMMKKIFIEVKKDLDYEPEFHTRMGIYYLEADKYLSLIQNSYDASVDDLVFLNNILNEAPNVIRLEDFNVKIGASKDEVASYLSVINKFVNSLK